MLCLLPNTPEHLIAINAAWAVGAIHVGVDNDSTGPELAALVRHIEPAALLFTRHPGAPDPIVAIDAVRRACPSTIIVLSNVDSAEGDERLENLLDGDDELRDWTPRFAPDDTAQLLITSSRTGRPQAVMETLPPARPRCSSSSTP